MYETGATPEFALTTLLVINARIYYQFPPKFYDNEGLLRQISEWLE